MAESYKHPESKKYKFRELRVYASTEWLADNKKKYRQVFDRYETTYIYAEVSFYNKYFDQEDWEIDVELRCYKLKKGREEVCRLPFEKRKVSKYDNVIYIREGWGNKNEGQFWKKGTYYWEAWIDDEKVATKYFYVEDAGKNAIRGQNPYLEVKSLRLYEGPYDDLSEDDRNYYKGFSSEETRYIYVELILKNLHSTKSWQCELFTKFYNDARELKGQVIRLQRVEKKDELIKITAGWGSNVKGSWRKDVYSAEIIFMDKLLAVIPFEVGEDFVEGIAPVMLPNRNTPIILTPDTNLNETFEEVMEKMDGLIGLTEGKKKVRDHAKYIQFLQLRKEKGFQEKDEINVHSVFIGNPGTGKTTVAGMMGNLYKKMGLLSKGHVHSVDRVDLVGEYIGQTAPKVKEAIKQARGGILFIDEAYSLARAKDDSKDFGREVIEILIKEMSDGKGDLAVIVAGYPQEMRTFMDTNPGLKSRFTQWFDFPDYMPQELSDIAAYTTAKQNIVISPQAKAYLYDKIVEAYRTRDRFFGNARYVNSLINESKINLGLRVMKNENPRNLSQEELSTIIVDDISKIFDAKKKRLPDIPIDENMLKDAMAELNVLIGLKSVKKDIDELVKLVRFYKEQGKEVLNKFSLHSVFVGNPGTGKTTVARILAKVFKALGVLERGHLVECDRQSLVAGYVGQTAIKTAKKIDDAIGGVLFIDEAYALSQGGPNDFGTEAIETLIKRMEDQKGEFAIITAGYPQNMKTFIEANPGLKSRFDRILEFEDFEVKDMMELLRSAIKKDGLTMTKKTDNHIKEYFGFLYDTKDDFFGNGRVVMKTIQEIIKNQNLRLASLPAEKRTKEVMRSITFADVENFNKRRVVLGARKKVGFRNTGSA